jgi:hypothetical protein
MICILSLHVCLCIAHAAIDGAELCSTKYWLQSHPVSMFQLPLSCHVLCGQNPEDSLIVVQATLPSKPNQNTSVPMMRGVYVAYAVVSWCYFGVSIAGYWAFGNNVMSNVIFSIGHPKWMVAMADLFVTVHVIGSYEVCLVTSNFAAQSCSQ